MTDRPDPGETPPEVAPLPFGAFTATLAAAAGLTVLSGYREETVFDPPRPDRGLPQTSSNGAAMSRSLAKPERPPAVFADRGRLTAAIFDVDGVLLASPHERAWREALAGLADPVRFTTAMYQAQVAGKPRADGALATLCALGVPDSRLHAPAYAEAKQARLEALIQAGAVQAFDDALRLVQALLILGWPLAVASSSKNANAMMQPIRLANGVRLLDAFGANLCGRDLRHGKPDPEIFLLAAAALGVAAGYCVVVEDAPAGIQAARTGGMTALGVARLHDGALLRKAAADLVVTSLDDVSTDGLAQGRLCRWQA